MTDYGLDIGGAFDLDPGFSEVRGPRSVALSVARRFLTPRGSLSYDPDFGFDLRELLSASLSPSDRVTLPRRLEAEAEKEERVRSASIDLSEEGDALRLRLALTVREGTFRFVLRIDRVSAALSEE